MTNHISGSRSFFTSRPKLTFKNLLLRLRNYALKHGINPRTFIILYISTFVVRWAAVGLGATTVLRDSHSADIAFLVVNRLSALIVPSYVLVRRTRHHWSVYLIYITLLVVGTIGIENLFTFLKSIFGASP